MHVRRFLAAMLAAQIGFTGCSGGGDSPTGPTTPYIPSPAVSTVSVKISTDTVALAGSIVYLQATAERSDGSKMDITWNASWASSDLSVATMGGAMLTALQPGIVQITASFQGKTGVITIRVALDGTPWSMLPPISAAGRERAQRIISANHGVLRWEIPVVSVWAQPGFKNEIVRSALDSWERTLEGGLGFTIVADSAAAKMRIVWVSSVANGCGEAHVSNFNSVISEVVIKIATNPGCYSASAEAALLLALRHDIGHGLGHLMHTADDPACENGDIMAYRCMNAATPPDLGEAMKWMYHVPPGTKPRDN